MSLAATSSHEASRSTVARPGAHPPGHAPAHPPGQSPIPSPLKRARTAAHALYTLSRDSSRLDQVLALNVSVNLGTARRGVRELGQTDEGRALFAQRPRIDSASVDLAALGRMPDGTLGREYIRFLTDNGITPDVFCDIPEVGDERAAYLVMRLRQTHDLWHVVTGYRPNVEGEILLQAFTFGQTRAPSAALITSLGTARYFALRPRHYARVRQAYRLGLRTRPLATFRWEDHWEKPLTELRTLLGVS